MPERPYVKTLNPYSRMALAVRGWGLEVVLALGVFVLWRIGAALDGPGLGILLLGIVGIVVWRTPAPQGSSGHDACETGRPAAGSAGC